MFICVSFLAFCGLLVPSAAEENNSIEKRSLLFPRGTVLQFTYGISSPLILPSRSIVFSWCLQANYDLPYNATLLRPKVIKARSERSANFDMNRQEFYRYIISYLEAFDFNGQECLLRLICEIAEYPVHTEQDENVLEKIVHHVFTPSLDEDGSVIFPNQTITRIVSFREETLYAEFIGKTHGNCVEFYQDCDIPLVDLFTRKYII